MHVCFFDFLSRCSDSSSGALPRAHHKKALKYAPVLSAPESYTCRGWSVEVLPWIVGIRGFIFLQGIQVAESFLDLPSSARRNIELCAAVESIESLAFMLQVRFAGSHTALTRSTCFPHKIQRKIPPCVGSSHMLHELFEKWKRLPLHDTFKSALLRPVAASATPPAHYESDP